MTEETRRVWDLPVRITHWLLLVGIAGSYATHEAGVAYFQYHVWFGYSVLVLASFRIVWGFVGTRHARFSSFLRGPRATAAYLTQVFRGGAGAHPGHNPAGAWMVVVLLLALLAQAGTGLFTNDEIFNTGPLYGYVGDALSLTLTSWHRRLFDWILILIAAHIAAIAAHRAFAGHRLVGPMFTGRKPAALVAQHEAIASSRLWLAAILLSGLVAGLVWIVSQAPEAQGFSFD
jgi:cytochrome b